MVGTALSAYNAAPSFHSHLFLPSALFCPKSAGQEWKVKVKVAEQDQRTTRVLIAREGPAGSGPYQRTG